MEVLCLSILDSLWSLRLCASVVGAFPVVLVGHGMAVCGKRWLVILAGGGEGGHLPDFKLSQR